MLVGGVVIGNDVDRHILGRFPVDLLEEAEPLHIRAAALGAGNCNEPHFYVAHPKPSTETVNARDHLGE